MRLQVNDYGFDAQLPQNEEESSIENSAKMFSILSDAIYKDKILAVIRELSCNARDAMRDAGRSEPFRIKMPTEFDPVFCVEDDGIGIHPSDMRKIYLTYGGSTKTEDDNAIGALGLGSKSPFAYTKSSFIVKNRWYSPPSNDPEAPQITEYTYFIFINAKGRPALSLVGAEPLPDGKKGITVELAVKPSDIDLFIEKVGRFYRYWTEQRPTIIGYDAADVYTEAPVSATTGNGWFLETNRSSDTHDGAIAIMGNIPYPILVDSIPDMPEELRLIAKNPFVITFPLGDLAFQPSREDLSYDEFTVKNLIARMHEVREEIASATKKKMFALGQTQVEFRHNVRMTIKDLAQTMTYRDGDGSSFAEWASKFLFGKRLPEATVDYGGRMFYVADLFDGEAFVDVGSYLPFCVYTVVPTRSGRRIFLRNASILTATAKKDVDYAAVFNERIGTLNKGWTHDFEWHSAVFNKRDDLSPIQNILNMGEESWAISYKAKLDVTMRTVRFIVSDEGGTGIDKVKALLNARMIGTKDDVFFVRFNQKETTAEDVTVMIGRFIEDAGLVGSTIERTSSLQDVRPPIVREKTASGKVKLFHTMLNVSSLKKSFYVSQFGMKGQNITCANARASFSKISDRDVFDLDTMRADGKWGYVLRTRATKNVYDYRNGAMRTSILEDSHLMSVAVHLGYLDDLVQKPAAGTNVKSYPILILNADQVHWLKKKGVDVVSVYDHIKEKVIADNNALNLSEKISQSAKAEAMGTIESMYKALETAYTKTEMTDVLESLDGTLFAELIAEYKGYLSNKIDARICAIVYVHNDLVGRVPVDLGDVRKRDEMLAEHYPMMRLCNLNSMIIGSSDDRIDILIDYVRMIDKIRVTNQPAELAL